MQRNINLDNKQNTRHIYDVMKTYKRLAHTLMTLHIGENQ